MDRVPSFLWNSWTNEDKQAWLSAHRPVDTHKERTSRQLPKGRGLKLGFKPTDPTKINWSSLTKAELKAKRIELRKERKKIFLMTRGKERSDISNYKNRLEMKARKFEQAENFSAKDCMKLLKTSYPNK